MLHTPAVAWFIRNPPAWLFTFVLVMVALEAAARRRRGLLGDRVDSTTSITLGVMYFAVKVVAGKALFLGVAVWIYDHLRLVTLPTHQPLTWVAVFVIGDFAYYWVHRAEHRYRVLWSSHLVHHSSTEFTFTTAVRNPWMEVLYKPLTGLWAPLIGVPPLAAATIGTVGLMVGLLQHTALVTTLGPLDELLMTPRNHRVHHASNPAYLDANFGGTLLVWDRMFGTYVRETEPARFGITKPLAGRGPAVVGAGGYPDLWADLRQESRWSGRLAALIARP
jgi:sterol desaturase/sphingolipid hydroxylase (fatty acid hydroxylase superfamily)